MGPREREDPPSREDSPLIRKKHGYSPWERCHKQVHDTTRVVLQWVLAGVLLVSILRTCLPTQNKKPRIAFIGNSMIYYNDLPRLLETLSDDAFEQNSCLHGSTSLPMVLETGNGMFNKFDTANAELIPHSRGYNRMYDWGACTVPQLLFGRDHQLDRQVHWKTGYLIDDGSNPCLQDFQYLDYLDKKKNRKPHWDFVFMNDNTRHPGRNSTRHESLEVLKGTYVPWLLALEATPVFLHTHAYWAQQVDLTGLATSEADMPHFTRVTYQGYLEYAALLKSYGLQPRIAPVGIAFLMVWEEDRNLWHKLYHSDHVHASPLGSFLTACVVHHTLFNKLPNPDIALVQDTARLWSRARVLQEKTEPPNPFPSLEEAEYLYAICERVVVQDELPLSFLNSTIKKS